MMATMLANPFETIEAPLIMADMLEEQGQDEAADHYRRMGNLLLQVRTPEVYLAELNRWETTNAVLISMRKDDPKWYGAMLRASIGDGERACNCKMAWKVSEKESQALSRLSPPERVLPRKWRNSSVGPRSISSVWVSERGTPLVVTGLSNHGRNDVQFFRLEGASMTHYLPLDRVGFLSRRHPTATWEMHPNRHDILTLVEAGEVVAVSAHSSQADGYSYLSL